MSSKDICSRTTSVIHRYFARILKKFYRKIVMRIIVSEYIYQ